MTDNDSKSRRALPQRAAKRKQDEIEEENLPEKKSKVEVDDSPPTDDTTSPQKRLSYRWIDTGDAVQGGATDHSLLEVVVDGVKSIIAVGDCVLLRSSEYDDSHGTLSPHLKKRLAQRVAFVAKVERMWEETGRKKLREDRMKIRARWFFKQEDVDGLGGAMIGPISRLQLVGMMTNRDLILSNQVDDNDVSTILGKCTVIMRRPSENDPIPNLPLCTFVARYSIHFGETPGSAVLAPFGGEDDLWPLDKATDDQSGEYLDVSSQAVDEGESETLIEERNPKETAISSENDTGSDGTTSSSSRSDDLVYGEGSTKGRIMVGPGHQATVVPYSGRLEVANRNPTQVWKPNLVVQRDLDAFLSRSADILTPYLKQNSLKMEDPYLPLPTEKVDVLIGRNSPDEFLTLSDVSTASSMSQNCNTLTRECKIDDLLAIFHSKKYDVAAALDAVALSPRDYVTSWSAKEKDLFDTGFRRYAGSLRMISKGIAISKSFKDVVDYHYRFKIPDQFRRYQDKKRESAVQMMNIVEGRKSAESLVQSRSDEMVAAARVQRAKKSLEKRRAHEWAKTAMTDVIGAAEDRRATAKELLLSIQRELGTDVMSQITEAIKLFHQRSVSDLKEKAVELLHEKPELLERFLDFLPKRFRF